jgi:hypothetical protein|tara:strand:+ start:1003 stop:1389 length:387 start_codon:yes stop_codon:yes gene_type:complete
MTCKNTLERAAKIMEYRGWCDGSLIDRSGRCCMLGAIFLAATGSDESQVQPLDYKPGKGAIAYAEFITKHELQDAIHAVCEELSLVPEELPEFRAIYSWNDEQTYNDEPMENCITVLNLAATHCKDQT